MASLNEIRDIVHSIAVEKGFWEGRKEAHIYGEATALALAMVEIGEAIQKIREGGKDDEIVEELADCVIRILDYSGYKKYDIERAIINKIIKNMNRPRLHGKLF